MGHTPRFDTNSHFASVDHSYTDVRGKQPHELHDQYVHPVHQPDPKLPHDPKMDFDKSHKKRVDEEIMADDMEIIKKKDEVQKKKMPAK
ncbi:13649_t:CDS:1, partial [Acaulospora colombiana]